MSDSVKKIDPPKLASGREARYILKRTCKTCEPAALEGTNHLVVTVELKNGTAFVECIRSVCGEETVLSCGEARHLMDRVQTRALLGPDKFAELMATGV